MMRSSSGRIPAPWLLHRHSSNFQKSDRASCERDRLFAETQRRRCVAPHRRGEGLRRRSVDAKPNNQQRELGGPGEQSGGAHGICSQDGRLQVRERSALPSRVPAHSAWLASSLPLLTRTPHALVTCAGAGRLLTSWDWTMTRSRWCRRLASDSSSSTHSASVRCAKNRSAGTAATRLRVCGT